MTYPITPKPSIHTDPTAKANRELQIQEERAAIHRLLAAIPLEIIELVVNAILGALHLSKAQGKVDDYLNSLIAGLQAFPGGNVSGATVSEQDLTDGIYQAINGVSTTGHTHTQVKGAFATWVSNLFGGSSVGTQIQIGAVPTGSIALTNTPVLQDMSDKVSQAVFGDDGIAGTLLTDMKNAVTNMRQQIQDLTQTVQSMQSSQVAQANSGTNVTIRFSDYPDGSLPGIFTVSYYGSGTSTVGITSGESCWRVQNNDGDRGAHVIYNVAPTFTDYQIIRGTMGNAPQANTHGNTPAVFGIGRVDSPTTPANYVWMRAYAAGFMTWHADIGCRKSGTDFTWVSGIPLGWNTNTYLILGANGNPITHQLWAGTALVKEYTELVGQPGGFSNIGSGFRYWGARTEVKNGSPGASNPGTIKGCSVSDNAPPTTVGSYGLVSRHSTSATSNVSPASTPQSIAGSAFDTTERLSADLTWLSATNRMEVSIEGTYICTMNVCNGSAELNGSVFNLGFIVHRTGSAVESWQTDDSRDVTSQVNFHHVHTFYLKAGDSVEPAFSNTNTSVSLVGNAAGTLSNFSMALANLSLN